MAGNVTFDTKDFDKKSTNFINEIAQRTTKAINTVADEILRLSQIEIPMKTRLLANSGKVEPAKDGVIVGYNKVYAARLHEHPEYRFNRAINPNAKGKYLEDPIKHNLTIFRNYIREILKG